MMSKFANIADLVVASDSFEYQGNTYEVWGLPLADIVHIVRNYGTDLAPLYQNAIKGKLPANMHAIGISLGDRFGALAGAIIASGVRHPELAENLAKLPFALQVNVLDKVLRLTMEAEGGLGKVVEIVTDALAAVKAAGRAPLPLKT